MVSDKYWYIVSMHCGSQFLWQICKINSKNVAPDTEILPKGSGHNFYTYQALNSLSYIQMCYLQCTKN